MNYRQILAKFPLSFSFNFSICWPNRKIKIFPKSIVRIELHAKLNRLFVQCINDPLIYAIETASAVVIQTIKYADHDHNPLLDIRNTFTVSPCGSLLFTKSPTDDQIKCIRLANEEPIADISLPISLTTRKYSITSLAYHPNKNLMVCSIFGDLINSSLFIITNEMDTNEQSVQPQPYDDPNEFSELNQNLNRNYHALGEWQKHHEDEFIAATDNGIKSIAIDSILTRIDDLFSMAIRSPNQNNTGDCGVSIDQFNEVQAFLDKIQIDSAQSKAFGYRSEHQPADETENHVSIELPCQSGDFSRPESKGYRMISTATNATNTAHSDDDSQSDASNHTFSVKPSAESAVVRQNSDENEPSNATFSVQSDSASNQSNRTFEIPKNDKQLEAVPGAIGKLFA